MKQYIFDAFPLLCWLQEEPGYRTVDDLLHEAEEGGILLYMQIINLGEVFYRVCRISSPNKAEEVISKVRMLPISFVSVTDSLVMEAARIKGIHTISYADAFAVATAIRTGSTLVTADPEYKAVTDLIEIEWIDRSVEKIHK